ncbi:hypothetical protein JCM33374_g3176 [Metschnikowia sp. JCM 33374]|nr:hypothetical protein JCM33374_g3176 [Metschnikowia sp. JCM 33374]
MSISFSFTNQLINLHRSICTDQSAPKTTMTPPNFTDNTSDPAKFNKWQAKIASYCNKIRAEIRHPYKIPDSELPSQEELDHGLNAIELSHKFLSPHEKQVTDLEAVVLAEKIAAGEYSAVEVFHAYAKRAVIAHQLTNCAMELFLEEGLKRAHELDEHFKQHGTVVGPLHGLPISLKEHLDVKNKVTHSSYVGWLDRVSPETSTTVQSLYDSGAVFYVRTSEPQGLMHVCSNNNITGKTRNPWNTALTPGGSSSGEGAIAAMKGSALGLGSDIGGSVRCPAAFCGVWGLRPSSKRLSLLHTSSAYVDQIPEIVVPVVGPFSRSADDLDLFMRASLAKEPWKSDASVLPIPWRKAEEPEPRSLKIAVIYDDGYVKPTPPILRGLKIAAEKLRAAGVTVVEWENIEVAELVNAACAAYTSDGNYTSKKQLAVSGEPLLPLTKVSLSFAGADTGISALEPETIHYWGYTSLWNILDFPNVVFPTGLQVDTELDAKDTSFQARNDTERYEYELYTGPEDFAGAPISLQLTGRRYADETVVKAAKVLHTIISKS